jgi:hypothetical protein
VTKTRRYNGGQIVAARASCAGPVAVQTAPRGATTHAGVDVPEMSPTKIVDRAPPPAEMHARTPNPAQAVG